MIYKYLKHYLQNNIQIKKNTFMYFNDYQQDM